MIYVYMQGGPSSSLVTGGTSPGSAAAAARPAECARPPGNGTAVGGTEDVHRKFATYESDGLDVEEITILFALLRIWVWG